MEENYENIDNDHMIILKCDPIDLKNCNTMKKNFKLIVNEEINDVIHHGAYQCYDNFYIDMRFSVYFDEYYNVYFMIAPFDNILRTPKHVSGLVFPVVLLNYVYGKLCITNGENGIVDDISLITTSDIFSEKYINRVKEVIHANINVDNRSNIYHFDTIMTNQNKIALVRHIAFDPEMSQKIYIKNINKYDDNNDGILAIDYFSKNDMDKYTKNRELEMPSKTRIHELKILETQINFIKDVTTNMEKLVASLSENELTTLTSKINKNLDKIKKNIERISKSETENESFKSIAKNAFNEQTINISQNVSKLASNITETNILNTSNISELSDEELIYKILTEKLVAYNSRNPEYYDERGLLQIHSDNINDNKTNTNKMKRLYDLYNTGSYKHTYDWVANFKAYMNNTKSGYQINHILLTNDKIGDDIVGGFLVIDNNVRNINKSHYYDNNLFKKMQGNEFTQVFITDTYQYSKNSDIPISFSYYLLTSHANVCNNYTDLDKNGWCATQEISKVYEYMMYNWKYKEKTNVTNILYYDCIRNDINKIEYIPEHSSTINDSHHLIVGFNILYQKEFSDLHPVNKFRLIHTKLNTKYGTKSLHTHISNEIKRSKESQLTESLNKFTESYMFLANVVIKSLELNLPENNIYSSEDITYSTEEILYMLLLDNIKDQYLFIKLKKIMESFNDILLIFVKIDQTIYTYYIKNISGIISVEYVLIGSNRPFELLEIIKKSFLELFQTLSIDNKFTYCFYDIISRVGIFSYLKSQMIQSINNMFSDESKILASYAVIETISSTNPSDFMKNIKTNKLYEAVYDAIKTAMLIGTFLTRYYEINKQYNSLNRSKFMEILNVIGTSIISRNDISLNIPSFLDNKNKDKYNIFIDNLISLIQTKFKYEDEITDFLNITKKQSIYRQLLMPNDGSSYAEILKIFKETEFGVEFESCFGVFSDVEINMQKKLKTYYDAVNVFVSEFNSLSSKYIPLNEQKQQNVNFIHDGGDVYSSWRLHEDCTVYCNISDTYSVEVVTPILTFGDSDNKASGKDEMWKTLSRKLYRENFGKRYEYSDGLFFLTSAYNLLLNNNVNKKYSPDVKIKTHANDSQGMHLHISNPYMMLETTDDGKFKGLGALKMIFFIRMFAWYEHVIRNFINRPPALQCHWAKSIYYDREKYLSDKTLGYNHKEYINKTTYDSLKLYIQDPEANDIFISEMFRSYRDELLVKCGRQYGGAFSIKIYNSMGKCHMSNVLKNLCCKGHLEIRLHHSTDDFAEVYNWILFINLFMSKCVSIVDKLYEVRNDNYEELFNTLLGEYSDFVPDDMYDNPDIMSNMFNKLFDDFIQNNTLKQFYRKRCKENNIKLHTKNSVTNLELHSPSIFSQDGELKNESILKSIMSVFPLDSTSLTSREDLIKTIKTINDESNDNYNLLNL